MPFVHLDEARGAGGELIREWLRREPRVARALLVWDLFGKLRLAVWAADHPDTRHLDTALRDACDAWWSGEILGVEQADDVTRSLYERAWRDARPDPDEPRFAALDRHRSRTAWFSDVDTPWAAPGDGPPVVVFYSFKGGLGRSTILASFAIQRAQAGERVCVVDLDLDSPGVGRLLAADADGTVARWGVVDFLLEHRMPDAPLSDYYHRCDRVAGAGEIVVFPAGRLDDTYPDKLAKVDLEEPPASDESGLSRLLRRIRHELEPAWILLDARTGMSESAGQLLSGVAHLHVLLATVQDQNWQGLGWVLDRLGRVRVQADRPQAEVILVQAMVPVGEAGIVARQAFRARAEQEFTDRYYLAAGPDMDDDRFWDTRDLDSLDAPHVAVPVDYDAGLASFRDIAEVSDMLCAGPYLLVAERIAGRFVRETGE